MALFASDEWVEALKEEANADEEMARAAKGFDATIQFMIKDTDERGDLPFWTYIKDGTFLEVRSGEKECDYTITGEYPVWKDIVGGKQDLLQAIMTKKLVFEGNMQTIMKYIKAVNLLMEAVQRVPTEFN
ncbi:MAG: SCP2 sterol-binding domain-containing protein [Actinobacteria bacterium]|nr:SCP2 sterol-binding domain-containing protein [Actinomycetota bacterium]